MTVTTLAAALLAPVLWFSACDLGSDKSPAEDLTFNSPDVALVELPEPDNATGPDVATSPDVTTGEDVPPQPEAITEDDVVPETCGNGTCDKHEDPCSCAQDCKVDEACCVNADCPQPSCGPCCHNVCQEFLCVNMWEKSCCWNGECEEGETSDNCPQDCQPKPECETDADCPQPQCGPCCKGQCLAGQCEDVWLDDCCWNGECEEGETSDNCPEDCPVQPECETDADCPQPKCGPCCKGQCLAGQCEDVWLDNCCWNGKCEEGEDPKSCPQDCPAELTECEQLGGICAPWDPQYTKCPAGTVPSGYACTYKSEVCCVKEAEPADCGKNPFGCQSDKECVKSKASCCPCNSGGKSIAVAKACEADWIKAMNCPPDLMCPMVYLCDDSVAVCMDGACTLMGVKDPVK
jgi:hypothetical protein